jgi:hypothetical protein
VVGRSEHLDMVAAVHGGASLNETAEGHVKTDSEGEDMAVSGEAHGKVVSITNRGTTGVVQSNFGNDFEVVELVTVSDSESVAEMGGHGFGFDKNRNTVTAPLSCS